jgi:anti-sigma B factor antagonist
MNASQLEIREHRVGDVAVLVLTGRIAFGDEEGALRAHLERLLDGGCRRVVLDLGGVAHIDSSGVGTIAGKWRTLRQQGGDLKLLHLTDRGKAVLQTMKLLAAFDTYESETAAVQSFARD